MDFLRLAWIAIEDVFSGFQPSKFSSVYLSTENFPKLLIGLLAISTTLILILGVPHLLINLFALLREIKNTRGAWGIKEFISRQNRIQIEYLEQLSAAEAELLKVDRTFSNEDDEAARKVLLTISQKDKGQLSTWWASFFSRQAGEGIKSLPQAIIHFVFSFASFTRSATVYTQVWNVWFAFRSFFPLMHPLLGITVLVFPEYFRVSTMRNAQSTPPSVLNGGLRIFWRSLGLLCFRRDVLKKLKTTENGVIKSETVIRKAVEVAAQSLFEKVRLRDRFLKVLWFDELYRLAIKKWVGNISAAKESNDSSIFLSSVDQWKLNLLNHQEVLELSPEQANALVREVASNFKPQKRSAFSAWMHSARIRLKNSIERLLDPEKSRQIQIIQMTNTQLHNPKAMARAVRSMLAANLVDKPLQLIIIFACYAGMQEGLLRPLQPEMFGPNSWFHLSRYVFINGFIYAVIAGIFSDTWLKIQQDTMSEGNFDLAPEGRDREKSFAGWFFLKTFWNPDNSWWKSQVFTVKQYILPTTKATFVTALIVNYISMGRFDLDSFLANLFVLVFLPFTGLTWKIEQGFEIASAWVVRDVPAHLRPHPLIQSYALREIAKRRIIFNVYYKIWENITFDFLAVFTNMNTLQFGTRSFSRLMLMGYTPTEWIVNPIRDAVSRHALPAPITWLLLKLDHLLTHDYTDGTKLR